jgi:putative nucleotidyltransferase with HDIG domain
MTRSEGRGSAPPSRGGSGGGKVTRRSRKKLTRRAAERTLEIWGALLEIPALWVALFVVLGAWLLAPASPLFVAQVPAGSIATRDYVAPRDLWLLDQASTQEKQRRAREGVLPVYDFDSAAIAARQTELRRLFAEGRRFLETGPEGGKTSGDTAGAGGTSGESRTRRGGEGSAAGAPETPGRASSLAEELAARLEEEPPLTSLKLTPAQIALLVRREFSSDLEDRLRSLVRQALQRGVVGNKTVLLENRIEGVTRRDLATGAETVDLDLFFHLGYPDELRDFLESEVRDWSGLSAAERGLLVDFLLSNLQPNLYFNQSETLGRREAAAASVDRVFTQVRKGQVVVRKGDEVDALAARIIAEIAGRRPWGRVLLPLAGSACLLLLMAAALWLALAGERVADHSRRRLLGEGLILLLLSLAGVKFFLVVAQALAGSFEASPFNSVESYFWAVPYATLGLLVSLLCGRAPALVLSLLLSLLAGYLAGEQALPVVVFSIAGSLTAVFAAERSQVKQRLVMARIGLLVGLVNVLMILILLIVEGEIERGPGQIGFDLLCGVAGGLLTAAVASFALPILESLLGFTTDIKLVELANTNLPLLRRLAFEAPGTFQHSLMVANLAKEGCEAIGADAVLAYTGALYHDIGKILRPDYFIENQRTGVNPHDKLQPSMSALILINHIKDGLELARGAHLPQPILDAIEQHHGNRLITFFYRRAQEQCDPDTEEVREEKYRYPGPRPRNQVQGVLMLADGVEAASRTLVEPTPAKIRGLIRKIVDDCLQDGQLDMTDLTLSDIKKVSDAFLRVLANLYHHRVDYPGFDFNTPPRREGEARRERERAVAKAS